MARRDGDRVVVAQFAHPGAQVTPAVDLVGCHPAGRHACLAGTLQHRGGQLGLGREHQLVRDSGQLAAFVIGCPVPRQVQGPVDEGLPRPARVGEVHGNLAQADAAQRAGVLACGTDSVRGRLLIACLVHHQYRLVIGELMRDPAGRPVAHGIVIPRRTGQEVLETVRAAVTEGFGQRPAVRPRHTHQHRLGHLPERLPRLAAREAPRHQARHLPEAVLPHLLRYRCLHGRRVLFCCHRRS